jgi:choline dehydrogenase
MRGNAAPRTYVAASRRHQASGARLSLWAAPCFPAPSLTVTSGAVLNSVAQAGQHRVVRGSGYDYVIVGGGSAGCVLAARLTQDPDVRVLLLEAGPADRNRFIHMPVGFYRMTSGPLTWGFRTAPQRHANNREIPFAQGRVIGGGSSINAEVFTRGAPEDYDRWAREEGCPGWSYAQVRPYFLRSEDNDTLAGEYHGTGGPLGVSTPAPQPLTRVFVQACQQAGIPHTADFNGPRQAGAGVYQTTTRDARRCSAAVGYLRPALRRRNLEVRTDCLALRIIIEGGRAVGTEYARQGRVEQARAEREVLVTAGAIGSPTLLLLYLPGVGENLHDHYGTDVVYELTGPWSLDKYQRWGWMLLAGLEYALFRKGPVASNIVEGGAFWWADRSASTPDTQFHFLAGAGVEEGIPAVPSGAGCTLNSYFVRPRSRGTVRLRSADPRDAPIIDPNYLADPYDVRMSIEGVKMMREIMRQPVWSRYIRREHLPGEAVRSDAEVEAYIRRQGRTCYHPVGACRMGSDANAVVDPQLRVRGIDGLRVCDSSVMPSLVSSNTNAPTIMIGEKAADLVRGNRAPASAAEGSS